MNATLNPLTPAALAASGLVAVGAGAELVADDAIIDELAAAVEEDEAMAEELLAAAEDADEAGGAGPELAELAGATEVPDVTGGAEVPGAAEVGGAEAAGAEGELAGAEEATVEVVMAVVVRTCMEVDGAGAGGGIMAIDDVVHHSGIEVTVTVTVEWSSWRGLRAAARPMKRTRVLMAKDIFVPASELRARAGIRAG